MATSQNKGQIPFRTKGQTTCMHHKRTQLDHYCEECGVPVCVECVSTVHKSHTLCRLSDITRQKKKKIKQFIKKSEAVDLVNIDKYIASTDDHIKDNASTFKNLSQKLTIQTNKLKEDLDLLAAQTLSIYQQLEEDNIKLLQTYKQDLERYRTELKQQVQECKIVLQQGSDIQIYETEPDIQSFIKLHEEPTLSSVSFSPNQKPHDHLEKALGEVSTSVGSDTGQGLHYSQSQTKCKVKSSSTQQTSEPQEWKPPTQQTLEETKEVTSPVDSLLSKTEVKEEWTSKCNIMSVCPTTNGQAWTSYYMSDILTLVDKNGKVLREIEHNTGISDISISPTNKILWACDLENNITELVSRRLVRRINSHKTPLCICITGDNHVIVGMTKHISKFTSKGTLVLTTLATRTGKSLVCTPHRITECPISKNVAVADRDNRRDGGNGKPYVVVMHKRFKKIFMYDGGIPQEYQHTSKSGGRQFNPWDVVYDSVGSLIIGDYDNNLVFLISGSGEFLRILHATDCSLFAVGVDSNDVLWTVFGGNKVKLLQYRS